MLNKCYGGEQSSLNSVGLEYWLSKPKNGDSNSPGRTQFIMNEKKITLDEAYKLAVDFHTKGKISEAKNIYEKILKVKPEHFLALTNLGIIFSQLRKLERALELFNKVIFVSGFTAIPACTLFDFINSISLSILLLAS